MRNPLYILSNGTYLKKSGDYLIADKKGIQKISIPIETVSHIVKMGNSQISQQVIEFCSEKNIPIFFLSYGGKYYGGFFPPAHNIGKTQQQQYHIYFNHRLKFAKEIISNASLNKITVLKRYCVKDKSRSTELKQQIKSIQTLYNLIDKAENIDVIRGIEGSIAGEYFAGLRLCFKFLKLENREYNPPKNEINALLSFIYSLLYSELRQKCLEHGLSLFVGVLHEQNNLQEPLIYDLSETFKQWCDLFCLSLINTRQIQEVHFLKKENDNCFLNTYGKQIVVKEWEKRLHAVSFHKETNSQKSFRELLRYYVICYREAIEENLTMEKFLL